MSTPHHGLGGGDGARGERAVDLLPEPLRTVLLAAAETVAQVLEEADPATVVDPTKLHSLINTFSTHDALRAYVARRCSTELSSTTSAEDDATQAARQLVDTDPAQAEQGAHRVHELLSAAVSQQRSQRRRDSRRDTKSAEERAAERTEANHRKLREARDRAQAQVERLEAHLANLRAQLTEAEEETKEAVQARRDTDRQLDRIRAQFRDPRLLAAALAEQLSEHTFSAHHPAESGRATDPFAILDTTEDVVHETAPMPPARTGAGDLDTNRSEEEAHRWTQRRRRLHRELALVVSPPAAFTRSRALRVEVLGAGTDIGGSCVLIEAADTRVVVDCGMRPRAQSAEQARPPGYERLLQGTLDAVVITHAHNDHAGWVPALLAETNTTVPVYATSATCDLLGTMWRDSAKVMERNGVEGYGISEVESAIDSFAEVAVRTPVRVGDLSIELFWAGHIVGAVGVVVSAGNQRVVVSGDVSASGQETVGGFSASAAALGADLLLLESTYAGNTNATTPRRQTVSEFMRQVETTVERGGIALVPAFALGRAQEVALLMKRHLPDVPVRIDGLAKDITRIYERHGPQGPRPIFSEQIQEVPKGGTERATREFSGGVVVTTSGMLSQGPAVTWARRVLPDPNSSLMVVGYQDEESPGRRLLGLAERGGGTFSLPGRPGHPDEEVDVYSDVGGYQLGAHANADELANIAAQIRAKHLMLVHGERRGQEQFALRMTVRAQTTVKTGIFTVK